MKKIVCFLFALPLAVPAATLTQVPMQGTMLMPSVSYSNSDSRVHVTMPAEVPQLTPLMASNPADGFNEADPWFQTVDPSREGQSFSRRYGFNMGTSDPLPANTAFWIRKLSASPELSFYRYNGSAPKAWEPIFGTAGAPADRYWNTVMFHPAVTAPPGTNSLTATFELFLMDTNLSQEVANSSSGPLVFNFANVCDGRPSIDMGLVFAFRWSTNATNWVVESANSLTATNWTTTTNLPTVFDGSATVIMGTGEAGRFYRLRRAP